LSLNINQSDLIYVNTNKNQFTSNLKFLHNSRKNQRKICTSLNNSSQLNLNNMQTPNLLDYQISIPAQQYSNENQNIENSILDKCKKKRKLQYY
jgi:hypothetical protein